MSDEQFRLLLEKQHAIQKHVNFISYLVTMLFVIDVIGPILQQFGLWNIMGLGQ